MIETLLKFENEIPFSTEFDFKFLKVSFELFDAG